MSRQWNALGVSHRFVKQHLHKGGIAIDATAGNGGDTLMLCETVGAEGKVLALDIQPQAVENTRKLLEEKGWSGMAQVVLDSHANLDQYALPESADCVMFNFGWLPGGDKSVTTLWETTHTAITSALSLLVDGGVCTVCAYPGHDEGDRERFALMDWLSTLRPQEYNVLHHRFLNAGPGAPECFVIQKQWRSSHGNP